MCGISGEIRFDDRPASAVAIEAMLRAQDTRGPDGTGIHVEGARGFGQKRLKIIDLSEKAHQPMMDNELGLGIVYNGAIYNYKELRAELQASGYRFFSNGDTEVILKAFHKWGRQFVRRLSGMFAFAIWERDSGRVVLGRDRLGIKPLYYAADGSRFRFASTLPALLAAGEVDTDIDPVALHHYLTFHSVVPPPRTILKGVRKLSPARLVEIDRDGHRLEYEYWRPQFPASTNGDGRDVEAWKERVYEALVRAVRRRTVADVPVGILLSGGLDSSLITALMAHELGESVATFSIGFQDVAGETGNEFQYSRIVAERFSTDHHQIEIEADRLLESLPGCIGAMSEPMISHDTIGFYLLSQEVSRHLKVVQSGQGADEVFAGYRWYPPLLECDDPLEDYARQFFDRRHEELSGSVHSRFDLDDFSSEFVRDHFATASAARGIDKVLNLDQAVMLVDDPVKRVDNMTMAWGLEARVPFLDHDVVELANSIPAELKVSNGGKFVLKEAARRVLPAEVIDRPKGYFPVPALKYLEGKFLDLARSALLDRRARERAIFREDHLIDLLERPREHLTPLKGSKLWQAALLELWLQAHEI